MPAGLHPACCFSRAWPPMQARLGLSDQDGKVLLEEAHAIYRRLMELDPMRRGFYQDAVEGKALVVQGAS